MATFNLLGVSPSSVIAGGTIAQYRAVVLSAANTGTAGSAITDSPIGASLNSAVTGELVGLQAFGDAKLTASAAIAVGAQVMVTAAGAGKVSTAAGATAKSIGIALEAAGADGDIIAVRLNIPPVNGPANA